MANKKAKTNSENAAETTKAVTREERAFELGTREYSKTLAAASKDAGLKNGVGISTIRSAMLYRDILTGTLTGVKQTDYGCFATLTFSPTDDIMDDVNIMISAENMGLNVESIKRGYYDFVKRNNLQRNEAQQKDDINSKIIQKLNGRMFSKVDFIPIEIFDNRTVIGNRIAAMKKLRLNYLPKDGSLPRFGVGSNGIARIVSVTYNRVIVELSGFEVSMSPEDISNLAVDTGKYRVGDSIEVTVSQVTENGLSLIGTNGHSAEVTKRIKEYRVGERVAGTVIRFDKTNARYIVRLANGAKGIAFWDKKCITINPQLGNKVSCYIIGTNADEGYVRCRIKEIVG